MGRISLTSTPPTQVVPFSPANLRALFSASECPAEDCIICRAIAGGGAKLVKGGELAYDTIPPEVQLLQYFLGLGENVRTNWVEVCSRCGRPYYCEESYEYLANGSEDYESYQALTVDRVLALAEVSWANDTGESELWGYDDGTWCLVHHPEKVRRK